MNRPRVVLDTNVLISAALKPEGLEAKIVEFVAARHLSLYVSNAILAEYRNVFARPKFAHIHPAIIGRLFDLIQDEATLVAPSRRASKSPDEPDNRFLECAAAANADYLITGNTKHFPKTYKKTKIVTARELFTMSEHDTTLRWQPNPINLALAERAVLASVIVQQSLPGGITSGSRRIAWQPACFSSMRANVLSGLSGDRVLPRNENYRNHSGRSNLNWPFHQRHSGLVLPELEWP